jgi:hypothetical protein
MSKKRKEKKEGGGAEEESKKQRNTKNTSQQQYRGICTYVDKYLNCDFIIKKWRVYCIRL